MTPGTAIQFFFLADLARGWTKYVHSSRGGFKGLHITSFWQSTGEGTGLDMVAVSFFPTFRHQSAVVWNFARTVLVCSASQKKQGKTSSPSSLLRDACCFRLYSQFSFPLFAVHCNVQSKAFSNSSVIAQHSSVLSHQQRFSPVFFCDKQIGPTSPNFSSAQVKDKFGHDCMSATCSGRLLSQEKHRGSLSVLSPFPTTLRVQKAHRISHSFTS